MAATAVTAVGIWSPPCSAQPAAVAVQPVAAATTVPAATAPASQADPLLQQLDAAIEVTGKRYLTANVHSPWQIFHGILALKRDFQLVIDPSDKSKKINAIEWIATSEPKFDNQPLLLKTPYGGKFHPYTRRYAFEGHPAQFLALLSQSDLPVDYGFKVGTEQIPLAQLLNNTMKEVGVNPSDELTWVLWALQHYLKPDAQWVNLRNEPWSIERLVQIETAAAVVGAPCGGNHRLFALTRTRDKHLKHGGQLNGVWAQADLKIRQHIELARSLQNSDGSFSAKFYQQPGYTNDLNERFNTTGHTMEFLSIGLPENRLHEPWVRNAVAVLCNELIVNRHRQIDCGPLYHSLNSLIIYRDRLRAQMPTVAVTVPAQPPSVTAPTTPAEIKATQQPVAQKASPSVQPESPPTAKPVDAKPTSQPVAQQPMPVPKDELKPLIKPETESIPSAIAPSTPAANEAAKLPVPALPVTSAKTLDPKRLNALKPGEIRLDASHPPALLPNVSAKPLKAVEQQVSGRNSGDARVVTLKPKIEDLPPPSRAVLTVPHQAAPVTQSGPPLTINSTDDEPISALMPANR